MSSSSGTPPNLRAIFSKYSRETHVFLLRFHRLVSTTHGADSLLCTCYYALSLLHSQLTRILAARYEKIALSIASRASATMLPGEAFIAAIEPPHLTLTWWCDSVKAVGDMIVDVRVFARLGGLLRLYVWAKENMGRRDPAIKFLTWGKLLSQTGFQVLENAAYLVRKGILRGELWESRERKLWVWSSRFWMANLMLELLRLARVRQLQFNEDFRAEKAEVEVKNEELEKRWRRNLYSTVGWIPSTLHWSLDDEDQNPLGEMWIGLSGMIPGIVALQDAWRETA